jgi:hypothetical protein
MIVNGSWKLVLYFDVSGKMSTQKLSVVLEGILKYINFLYNFRKINKINII